jgi:hypothetical protein
MTGLQIRQKADTNNTFLDNERTKPGQLECVNHFLRRSSYN